MIEQAKRMVWIRQKLCLNPEADFEDIHALWKQECPNEVPPNGGMVGMAKKNLCKRYGLDDISQFPMSKGKPNMSALCRLLLAKDIEMKDADAVAFLAEDGLELPQNRFNIARSKFKKETASEPKEESTRARFRDRTPKGEGPKSKSKRNAIQTKCLEVLLLMETNLETLNILLRAEKIDLDTAADRILHIRRLASKHYLEIEE